jgi:hypothetical protein
MSVKTTPMNQSGQNSRNDPEGTTAFPDMPGFNGLSVRISLNINIPECTLNALQR